MLNHYVAKMIIRSYKTSQNELAVFDFNNKQVKHISGREIDSLFTMEDALSPNEEQFINQSTESYISQKVIEIRENRLRITDESNAALHMMFFFQIARLSLMTRGDRSLFDSLHHMRKNQIFEFVGFLKSKYKLVILQMNSKCLFCPEIGVFPVLYTGENYRPTALFAMPIEPDICLLQMPIETEGIDWEVTYKSIWIDSIGYTKSEDKLIIPEYYLEDTIESELIDTILGTRERNDVLYKKFYSSLSYISQLSEQFGI